MRPPDILTFITLKTMHDQFKYCLFPANWGHTQPSGFMSSEDAVSMTAFGTTYMAICCLNSEKNTITKKVSRTISYTFDAESMIEY
jgi:hypothetical protein